MSMYCSHCGFDLKDEKVKVANKAYNFGNADTKVGFVCPRCGRVIKEDLSSEEVKSLARASHAEIHRARNSKNRGMCFLVIGVILLIISFLFFLMSFKAAQGGQLVLTSTEFYVFICLLALSVISIVFGLFSLIRGILKEKKYSSLLKDIQNECFIQ